MPNPAAQGLRDLFMSDKTAPEVVEAVRRDNEAGHDEARTWVDPRGYTLSDRVWSQGQGVRAGIERELRKGLASGRDPLKIARDVEQYLLPSERGRRTSKPRSGSGVYSARRLARTEVSRAMGAASILSSNADPLSDGVEWLLANSHPKTDHCDDNANHDEGLGRGVWPTKSVPRYPDHPHCLCTLAVHSAVRPGSIGRALRESLSPGSTNAPPASLYEEWGSMRAGDEVIPSGYLSPAATPAEAEAFRSTGAFPDRIFRTVVSRRSAQDAIDGGIRPVDGYLGTGIYTSVRTPTVGPESVVLEASVNVKKPLILGSYQDFWTNIRRFGLAKLNDHTSVLRWMGYDSIYNEATGDLMVFSPASIVFTPPGDVLPEKLPVHGLVEAAGRIASARFDDPKAMSAWASEILARQSYGQEALRAIRRYQEEPKLNQDLRKASPEGDALATVQEIDRAIAGSVFDRDVLVFRGVDEGFVTESGLRGPAAIGSLVTDAAFTSTTLDAAFADQAARSGDDGAVVEILIPAGTQALPVPPLNAQEAGMREVILPRRSTYQIVAYAPQEGGTPPTYRAVLDRIDQPDDLAFALWDKVPDGPDFDATIEETTLRVLAEMSYVISAQEDPTRAQPPAYEEPLGQLVAAHLTQQAAFYNDDQKGTDVPDLGAWAAMTYEERYAAIRAVFGNDLSLMNSIKGGQNAKVISRSPAALGGTPGMTIGFQAVSHSYLGLDAGGWAWNPATIQNDNAIGATLTPQSAVISTPKRWNDLTDEQRAEIKAASPNGVVIQRTLWPVGSELWMEPGAGYGEWHHPIGSDFTVLRHTEETGADGTLLTYIDVALDGAASKHAVTAFHDEIFDGMTLGTPKADQAALLSADQRAKLDKLDAIVAEDPERGEMIDIEAEDTYLPAYEYESAAAEGADARSHAEFEALDTYIGAGYGPTNKYLRNGEDMSVLEDPFPADQVAEAMNGLIARQRFPHETIIFRGAGSSSRYNPDTGDDWAVGDVFVDPGFVSHSYQLSTAASFAENASGENVIYRVLMEQGDAALVTKNESEGEIILPAGSAFAVLRIWDDPGDPDFPFPTSTTADVVIDLDYLNDPAHMANIATPPTVFPVDQIPVAEVVDILPEDEELPPTERPVLDEVFPEVENMAQISHFPGQTVATMNHLIGLVNQNGRFQLTESQREDYDNYVGLIDEFVKPIDRDIVVEVSAESLSLDSHGAAYTDAMLPHAGMISTKAKDFSFGGKVRIVLPRGTHAVAIDESDDPDAVLDLSTAAIVVPGEGWLRVVQEDDNQGNGFPLFQWVEGHKAEEARTKEPELAFALDLEHTEAEVKKELFRVNKGIREDLAKNLPESRLIGDAVPVNPDGGVERRYVAANEVDARNEFGNAQFYRDLREAAAGGTPLWETESSYAASGADSAMMPLAHTVSLHVADPEIVRDFIGRSYSDIKQAIGQQFAPGVYMTGFLDREKAGNMAENLKVEGADEVVVSILAPAGTPAWNSTDSTTMQPITLGRNVAYRVVGVSQDTGRIDVYVAVDGTYNAPSAISPDELAGGASQAGLEIPVPSAFTRPAPPPPPPPQSPSFPAAKVDFAPFSTLPFDDVGANVVRQMDAATAAQTLTLDEVQAIDAYISADFDKVNQWLRTGKNPQVDGYGTTEVAEISRALDGLMGRTRTSADMLLYRGANEVKTFGGITGDDAVGVAFTDRGYVSASGIYRIAEDFARGSTNPAMLRILVPAGSNAVPTQNNSEGEVILPRNAEFVVVGYHQGGTIEPPMYDVVMLPSPATAAQATRGLQVDRSALTDPLTVLDEVDAARLDGERKWMPAYAARAKATLDAVGSGDEARLAITEGGLDASETVSRNGKFASMTFTERANVEILNRLFEQAPRAVEDWVGFVPPSSEYWPRYDVIADVRVGDIAPVPHFPLVWSTASNTRRDHWFPSVKKGTVEVLVRKGTPYLTDPEATEVSPDKGDEFKPTVLPAEGAFRVVRADHTGGESHITVEYLSPDDLDRLNIAPDPEPADADLLAFALDEKLDFEGLKQRFKLNTDYVQPEVDGRAKTSRIQLTPETAIPIDLVTLSILQQGNEGQVWPEDARERLTEGFLGEVAAKISTSKGLRYDTVMYGQANPGYNVAFAEALGVDYVGPTPRHELRGMVGKRFSVAQPVTTNSANMPSNQAQQAAWAKNPAFAGYQFEILVPRGTKLGKVDPIINRADFALPPGTEFEVVNVEPDAAVGQGWQGPRITLAIVGGPDGQPDATTPNPLPKHPEWEARKTQFDAVLNGEGFLTEAEWEVLGDRHNGDKVGINEYQAIDAYIGKGFDEVNTALRQQQPLGKYEEMVREMDGLVGRSVTERDMILIRGANADSVLREAAGTGTEAIGAIIRDGGYTSASFKPQVAASFARGTSPAFWRIMLPKGSVAYVSKNLTEGEVILPHGTQFQVVDYHPPGAIQFPGVYDSHDVYDLVALPHPEAAEKAAEPTEFDLTRLRPADQIPVDFGTSSDIGRWFINTARAHESIFYESGQFTDADKANARYLETRAVNEVLERTGKYVLSEVEQTEVDLLDKLVAATRTDREIVTRTNISERQLRLMDANSLEPGNMIPISTFVEANLDQINPHTGTVAQIDLVVPEGTPFSITPMNKNQGTWVTLPREGRIRILGEVDQGEFHTGTPRYRGEYISPEVAAALDPDAPNTLGEILKRNTIPPGIQEARERFAAAEKFTRREGFEFHPTISKLALNDANLDDAEAITLLISQNGEMEAINETIRRSGFYDLTDGQKALLEKLRAYTAKWRTPNPFVAYFGLTGDLGLTSAIGSTVRSDAVPLMTMAVPPTEEGAALVRVSIPKDFPVAPIPGTSRGIALPRGTTFRLIDYDKTGNVYTVEPVFEERMVENPSGPAAAARIADDGQALNRLEDAKHSADGLILTKFQEAIKATIDSIDHATGGFFTEEAGNRWPGISTFRNAGLAYTGDSYALQDQEAADAGMLKTPIDLTVSFSASATELFPDIDPTETLSLDLLKGRTFLDHTYRVGTLAGIEGGMRSLNNNSVLTGDYIPAYAGLQVDVLVKKGDNIAFDPDPNGSLQAAIPRNTGYRVIGLELDHKIGSTPVPRLMVEAIPYKVPVAPDLPFRLGAIFGRRKDAPPPRIAPPKIASSDPYAKWSDVTDWSPPDHPTTFDDAATLAEDRAGLNDTLAAGQVDEGQSGLLDRLDRATTRTITQRPIRGHRAGQRSIFQAGAIVRDNGFGELSDRPIPLSPFDDVNVEVLVPAGMPLAAHNGQVVMPRGATYRVLGPKVVEGRPVDDVIEVEALPPERFAETFEDLGVETFNLGSVGDEAVRSTLAALAKAKSAGQKIPARVFAEPFDGDQDGRIVAKYDQARDAIMLNANVKADFWARGDAEMAKLAARGWTQAETIEDLVTHEIGHAVQHKFYRDRGVNLLRFAADRFAGEPKIQARIVEVLGRYAGSNRAEFLAEAYLALAKGKNLPADIMAEYERLKGIDPRRHPSAGSRHLAFASDDRSRAIGLAHKAREIMLDTPDEDRRKVLVDDITEIIRILESGEESDDFVADMERYITEYLESHRIAQDAGGWSDLNAPFDPNAPHVVKVIDDSAAVIREIRQASIDGRDGRTYQLLSSYKGDGFAPTNRLLRTGSLDKPKGAIERTPAREDVDALIAAMDGAIDRVRTTGEIRVYRAMSFAGPDNDPLAGLGPGDTTTDAAFMSTTLKAEGTTFGGPDVVPWGDRSENSYYVQIAVPEGYPALYLDPITSDKIAGYEREIVLPRNTTLRIRKIERREGKRTRVYAEVVTDDSTALAFSPTFTKANPPYNRDFYKLGISKNVDFDLAGPAVRAGAYNAIERSTRATGARMPAELITEALQPGYPPGAMAFYDWFKDQIGIIRRDDLDVRDMIEGMVGQGFVVPETIEEMFVHEMGHAIHAQRLAAEYGIDPTKTRDIVQMVDDLAADHDPIWADSAYRVSRYAGTSATEFVAETFTGLMKGIEYDDTVMALYDALSGPRPDLSLAFARPSAFGDPDLDAQREAALLKNFFFAGPPTSAELYALGYFADPSIWDRMSPEGKTAFAIAAQQLHFRGVDVSSAEGALPINWVNVELLPSDAEGTGTIMGYRASRNELLVSKTYTFDLNKWKAALERAGDQEWHADASLVGSIVHELGHAAHYNRVKQFKMVSDIWPMQTWPEAEAFLDEVFDNKGVPLEIIAMGVSRYAMTQPKEFVAEAFAALVNNEKLSELQMGLYEALGGPEVGPDSRNPPEDLTPEEFDAWLDAQIALEDAQKATATLAFEVPPPDPEVEAVMEALYTTERPPGTEDFRALGVEFSGAENLGARTRISAMDALRRAQALGVPLPARMTYTHGYDSPAMAQYDYARDEIHIIIPGAGVVVEEGGAITEPKPPYEAFDEATIKQEHDAGFLVGDTLSDMIVHEIGHQAHRHMIERWFASKDRRIPLGAFNAWRKNRIFHDQEKIIAEKVSRYAAQSPAEFVAETFLGLAKGIEYDDDVMATYTAMRGWNPGIHKKFAGGAPPEEEIIGRIVYLHLKHKRAVAERSPYDEDWNDNDIHRLVVEIRQLIRLADEHDYDVPPDIRALHYPE